MEIYIVTSEHYWEVYGVTKILSGGVELIFKLYIYIYSQEISELGIIRLSATLAVLHSQSQHKNVLLYTYL